MSLLDGDFESDIDPDHKRYAVDLSSIRDLPELPYAPYDDEKADSKDSGSGEDEAPNAASRALSNHAKAQHDDKKGVRHEEAKSEHSSSSEDEDANTAIKALSHGGEADHDDKKGADHEKEAESEISQDSEEDDENIASKALSQGGEADHDDKKGASHEKEAESKDSEDGAVSGDKAGGDDNVASEEKAAGEDSYEPFDQEYEDGDQAWDPAIQDFYQDYDFDDNFGNPSSYQPTPSQSSSIKDSLLVPSSTAIPVTAHSPWRRPLPPTQTIGSFSFSSSLPGTSRSALKRAASNSPPSPRKSFYISFITISSFAAGRPPPPPFPRQGNHTVQHDTEVVMDKCARHPSRRR